MGVTIFYRGRIDDLSRIEDFEDRVLDLALDLGGAARIWRSSDDDDPRRRVRGLILNLAPGQESTSLLISPEGWLIGLMEIEDAERGRLSEPPWCFVKTQFGSVEGHVAVVELLAALKREFFSDLEVNDEGGYWETRDLTGLKVKLAFVQAAIDGFADGLRRHGLSREAAEDPEILEHRLVRIAEIVRRSLKRPSEDPSPATDSDETRLESLEDPRRAGGVRGRRTGRRSVRHRRRCSPAASALGAGHAVMDAGARAARGERLAGECRGDDVPRIGRSLRRPVAGTVHDRRGFGRVRIDRGAISAGIERRRVRSGRNCQLAGRGWACRRHAAGSVGRGG